MAIFSSKKKDKEEKKAAKKKAVVVDRGQKKQKKAETSLDVSASKNILFPLITEKGVLLQEDGFAVFRAGKKITKPRIKQIVKAKYKVDVKAVKTMHMAPKKRRRGATVGKTAGWKKVYVKVDDVSKIVTGP